MFLGLSAPTAGRHQTRLFLSAFIEVICHNKAVFPRNHDSVFIFLCDITNLGFCRLATATIRRRVTSLGYLHYLCGFLDSIQISVTLFLLNNELKKSNKSKKRKDDKG